MRVFIENVTCMPGEFRCDDGTMCIRDFRKCDGRAQCTDGSDESPANCGESSALLVLAE